MLLVMLGLEIWKHGRYEPNETLRDMPSVYEIYQLLITTNH